MAGKIKRYDQLPRVTRIPEGGTNGAQVGRDLRWPDGTVVQESQIRQSTTPQPSAAATLWRLIREIPQNIQRLAALVGVGFTTRDVDGNWMQRSIAAGDGIDVANGDGVAGDPTVSLEDLPDTGAGAALVRITRDAKGRVAGTQSASTTDLAEGTNLYFTNARVDARIAAQKGQPNGITPLGPDSLIPTQYLPPLAITETYVVDSQAAQLALDAQEGDVAVRTDLSKNFIHNGGTSGTMADWTELLTPAAPVQSVNGQTGNVVLTAADVGAATATQGAKADTAVQEVRPGTGVTVDNTDPRRPIVNATPVASGVPEAPNDTLIYARGSLDWQPLTGPQSRYHLLQYPLLTDQLGNQLTDQLGRPLWSNAPQVPYSWLTGVPANLAAIAPLTGAGYAFRSSGGAWSLQTLASLQTLPAMTLAEANALTGVGDFQMVAITDLAGGREPCWYDSTVATGTKWRRFSDRSIAN